MRLRNVPGARESIGESPYCIQEPEKYRGSWCESLFHNDHPLYIEIGMGKGSFLHTMATAHPDINFLGLEKYSSVLIRAVEKREADEREIDNLYYIRFDATEIESIFAENEVERIYLNFSDPWPKDRHAKRRLTSPEFLARYDRILNPAGSIRFKTDNRALFDYSEACINESDAFMISDLTHDLHHSDRRRPDDETSVMTEYEQKFSAQGNPICWMSIRRKQDDSSD